jgi:hypothetical protein
MIFVISSCCNTSKVRCSYDGNTINVIIENSEKAPILVTQLDCHCIQSNQFTALVQTINRIILNIMLITLPISIFPVPRRIVLISTPQIMTIQPNKVIWNSNLIKADIGLYKSIVANKPKRNVAPI